MRPGHDCFRPDYGSRVPDGRRDSMRGDRDNQFDWRRDDRENRRDGRAESIAAQSEVERATSSAHRGNPQGQPRQSRSNSVTGPKHETHNITVRNNTSSNHNSMVQQTSPTTVSTSASIPTNPRLDRSYANQKPLTALSPTEPIDGQKTADPRPHAPTRSAMPQQNLAASPASSSADEGHDGKGYGWLTKELTNIVASRIELKREFSKLQSQLKKCREDLTLANKMFSSSNPYIEKLNEDIQVAGKAYEAKRAELDVLTKKEESAIRALSAQNRKSESLKKEIVVLKKSLEEEQNRTKGLRTANDGLQQQIDELKTKTDELSAQMTPQNFSSQANLQTQIDELHKLLLDGKNNGKATHSHVVHGGKDLADMQNELKKFKEFDMEAVARQVTSHQVEIAHLNNVLITQGSLKDINTRLDELNGKLTSDSLITMSQLDGYVQYFNSFEKRTEARIRTVEELRSNDTQDFEKFAKITDLEEYAKAEKLSQYAKQEQLGQYVKAGDLDQYAKAEILDQYLKPEDLTKIKDELLQLQLVVNRGASTASGFQQDFQKRVESLERMRQEVQQTPNQIVQNSSFSRAAGEQLQLNLAGLQATIGRLTETCNGNSHTLVNLSQRFNNITTQDLAQRMASMIGPMLAPQVTRLQGHVHQMQAQQTAVSDRVTAVELQAKQAETRHATVSNRMATIELQARQVETKQNEISVQIQNVDNKIPHLEYVQDNMDHADTKMSDLENSITKTNELISDFAKRLDRAEDTVLNLAKDSQTRQRFEKDLESARSAIVVLQEHNSGIVDGINGRLQIKLTNLESTIGLKIQESFKSTKENYETAISEARVEQDDRYEELVDQVKEARDYITARLVNVENEIASQRQNKVATNYTEKTETPPKAQNSGINRATNGLPISRGESSKATKGTNGSIASKQSPNKISVSSKAATPKGAYTDSSALGKHFITRFDRNIASDTIVVSPNMNAIIVDSDDERMDTRGDQTIGSDSDPSLSTDDPKSDYWQKPGESSKNDQGSKNGNSKDLAGPRVPLANTGNNVAVKRSRDPVESTPKSSQASNASRSATPRSSSRNRKKAKH